MSQMGKMTEQDWLTTTNPYDLTHYKACRSNRKRRLFSCAVARHVLFLISDGRYQQTVELAERYADGVATEEEMRATRRLMKKLWNERQFMEAGNHAATAVLATLNKEVVGAVHGWENAAAAQGSLARPYWRRGYDGEQQVACAFARDVFGNPFRPVTLDRAWLTASITGLAQAAYEERRLPEGTLDQTRLAVLADALEEAGCDNLDVLAHCRKPTVHVRGCWVLDLLLGRS
jgi:hypothetical protein